MRKQKFEEYKYEIEQEMREHISVMAMAGWKAITVDHEDGVVLYRMTEV